MSFFQTGMSENVTIYITMVKNWVSQILFHRKKGAYRIPGSAEKGAIRAAHPYYVIYRQLASPRFSFS